MLGWAAAQREILVKQDDEKDAENFMRWRSQKFAFSHKGSLLYSLRASPPIGNVGLDANLGPPFRLYVLTRNLTSSFSEGTNLDDESNPEKRVKNQFFLTCQTYTEAFSDSSFFKIQIAIAVAVLFATHWNS